MRLKRAVYLGLCLSFWCLAVAQSDLFATARDGTVEQVTELLSQGLEIDVTDEYGQTPLMYAATGNEDPDVITVLVDSGADVNTQTLAGWTALMYAVRDNANPEVAERLLNLGADAELQNSDNLKALDYADANSAFKASSTYQQLLQLATPAVEEAPEPVYEPPPAAETQSCCKYCTTGKACGNSCISSSYNCYKGAGCACNASDLDKDSTVYAMLMMMQPEPPAAQVNPVAESVSPFIDCGFAASFSNILLATKASKLAYAQ